MAEIEVKEQCKKCFHFQVCANVLKQQLYIRKKMLKEEEPKCDNFVPTYDVDEVVHGEWVDIKDYGGGKCLGHCSVCWAPQEADNPSVIKEVFRYCRWCGAKMDGRRR